MDALPLPLAAGQTLIAGFDGLTLPERVRAGLAEGRLGGTILFRRNVGSLADVARLTTSIAEAAHEAGPPLVSVDQEGGRVARLGPPVLSLPPMRRLGERDDEDLTRGAARTLGAQLAALGFSMDFAPVLDVDTNPDNPVIGDRAFGRDPDGVIRHGLAFAAGLAEGGVDGCGKHFPGHGDTDLDSHLKLPRLSHARSRLDAVELKPFHAAARARLPAIMTAHVVFDALDPGVPATLSHRVVTGLLRGELRFEGAIVSDDLEMKAVSDAYAIDEAAVAAIDAGCDLLLVCSDLDACFAAHEALVRRAEGDAAFATRLQEAAQRSLRLRRARPPRPVAPAEVDAALAAAAGRAELERDLAALFQGPAEGR